MVYEQICQMLDKLGIKYYRDDEHFDVRIITFEDGSIITSDGAAAPWDLVDSQGILRIRTLYMADLERALKLYGFV